MKIKLYYDFIFICYYLGFDLKIIQIVEMDLVVLGLVFLGLGVVFVLYCYKNIYFDLINYKLIKNYKLLIKIELVWNEKYF